MRSRCSSHVSLLVAFALTLGSSAIGAPTALAQSAVPVLWMGEVRTPGGQPAPAEVVAYVRPPASQLSEGNALVPLARTETDRGGRFTLRAAPNDTVDSLTDPAGWVTVMVAAFSDEGMSLAVDSVAWRPAGRAYSDRIAGRWVTSPAQLSAPSGYSMDSSTDGTDTERPRVMVVAGGGHRPMERRPTGPDPAWCTGPHKTTNLGKRPVAVGELHMNSNWGGLFEYTNTESTSFQVGLSINGGRWQVGGSVSFDDSGAFGQETKIRSAKVERLHTYKAEMIFKRFTWRCVRGGWHDAETIEPVDWTGDMDLVRGGTPPRCNRKFVINALPRSETKRRGGSGTTLRAAISIAGFTGSMTSSTSTVVRQEWHNPQNRARELCGSENYPTKYTRVYSVA